MQILHQDETPFLYSLVFGEGVVNDATSVVLFNAIQNFDLTHIRSSIALKFFRNFLYLFGLSTMLGIVVYLPLLPLFYPTKTTQKNSKIYSYNYSFYSMQTGLLSAYIIKNLYFGRSCNHRNDTIFPFSFTLYTFLISLIHQTGIRRIGRLLLWYSWLTIHIC